MSFCRVYSAQATTIGTDIVEVEADLSRGLYTFSIVGLPEKSVEEARDRISAAVKNTGFTSPKQKNQKVVISLAPASLKKEGVFFDVAIAVAYLSAAQLIRLDPRKRLFVGELSLDGTIQPALGILPLVHEAKKRGFAEIFVPRANAREAALVSGISVFGVDSLHELICHVNTLSDPEYNPPKSIALEPKTPFKKQRPPTYVDLSDIRGQEGAKRALEIAASGGHNVALHGPPGTGKPCLLERSTRSFRH